MKHFCIVLLACIFCVNGYTQNPDSGQKQRPHFSPQEFTKRQEAFIIREAGLSPFEAANFFPLYHKLGKEKWEINAKIGKLMGKAKSGGQKEKEYIALLEEIDKLQLDKVKLESNYHQKFRKVLSTEKVLRVMDADGKFDRQILKEMMKRHPMPQNMSNESVYETQSFFSGNF